MTDPKHTDKPIIIRPRVEKFAVAALVLVVIAVTIAAVALVRASSAERDAHRQASAKQGVVQALATANSSLTKNGLAPVATPTEAGPAPTVTKTVTQPITGAQGPGPSADQIQIALTAYCATRNQCFRPPSANQVAAAVATYCDVHGKCQGSPGASGKAGTSGPPGASGAPGTAGQNATTEQVADAVSTYCSTHNQCQGAPGSPGPSGMNGADGSSGAPGQPPYSWTWTTTDALGGQHDHTCTRSEPFDASAPTYTCS